MGDLARSPYTSPTVINNLPLRESIERRIGRLAADAVLRFEQSDVSASDMILTCRRLLDLWVEGGGASTDDEVVGVLGIESQCDHVLLGPGQRRPRFPEYHDEQAEIESRGVFFRDAFIREMRELAARFNER